MKCLSCGMPLSYNETFCLNCLPALQTRQYNNPLGYFISYPKDWELDDFEEEEVTITEPQRQAEESGHDSFYQYMINQLRNYIAEERGKGVSDSEIKFALENAGHKKNVIDEAFEAHHSGSRSQQSDAVDDSMKTSLKFTDPFTLEQLKIEEGVDLGTLDGIIRLFKSEIPNVVITERGVAVEEDVAAAPYVLFTYLDPDESRMIFGYVTTVGFTGRGRVLLTANLPGSRLEWAKAVVSGMTRSLLLSVSTSADLATSQSGSEVPELSFDLPDLPPPPDFPDLPPLPDLSELPSPPALSGIVEGKDEELAKPARDYFDDDELNSLIEALCTNSFLSSFDDEGPIRKLASRGTAILEGMHAALTDPSSNLINHAAEVLAIIGADESIPHVVEALPRGLAKTLETLKNPETIPNYFSAGVLDGIERFGSRAVVPLIDTLQKSDEEHRASAALALSELTPGRHAGQGNISLSDCRATAHALAEALRRDSSAVVRRAVVFSLGYLRLPETVDSLVEGGDDSDFVVVAASARSLGRLYEEVFLPQMTDFALSQADVNTALKSKAPDLLLNLLSHERLLVRSEAVLSLGKLAVESAVEPLLNLLSQESQDDELVRNALYALCMLIGYRGGEQITDHIVPHIIYHSGSPKALARLRTKGVETLMQLTNHDDEKIREVSISLLGELGAADSVELLAGALYDQKQQVRMRAIRALGKVASSKVAVSRALSILTQAVEKEKENRYSFGLNETLQELVLTIASLNNVESRNTVEKLAQDPNVDVRCAAAHALGQSHWPNSSHILLELLEDNDEQARGAAATALGKLGDPSNLKQLILVYLDPGQPPGVRDKARDAIWNVDSPTVVEFFVEHMNDLVDRDHARENDPEEAAQLAFTSLLSTSTDHLGSILEQLVHGSEWAQRRVAGLLLKSAGEKRGFGYPTELRITRWVKGHAITVCDLLQPLLGHPDEEVRLAAAITLAKAGCEDAFESIAAGLAKFLEREEWPEVVACAAALGRLGDERAINILERTRQCDDGWASLAASVSLGFLGVDQDNALQEWTSLSFSMGEKDMLPLIAELGGEKAIPKLAQALDLGALQEDVYPLMLSVGYTEVFDEVVGLLAREEWNVREKAVLALGTAGDLRGANYLKILLSDPQPAVRQAAQEAFGTLTRPYQPDLAFSLNADNQLRTGDWTPAHLHLHNGGQGEASNITLDWPEEFAEMRYIGETSVVKLLPDESADLALTVRPQSAGSAVPLEVSLHYADAFGFEHKLQRATTIQVVREWLGPQTQQTLVVHGSYYKDSVQVTGDVGLIRSVGPTRSQPETTPLQCANCGEKLVEGWKVCPKCGVPVKRRCPSCGHNLETDWLFCPACATRVSDELEED